MTFAEKKEHYQARAAQLGSFLQALPVVNAVSAAADELGLEAYIVGGFVRDFILSRNLDQLDLDFVTVGNGIALAEAAAVSLGRKKKEVVVFKTFGTASFIHQGQQLEFVGARRESYSPDSRKPDVEPGNLRDDQLRRDFTINALAVCINQARFGELLDPFSGLDDLASRTIQTPTDPDITFSDDPLRMMRAIRFASQLGFDIAPDTFEAIQRNAERLDIISAERISTELNKIILSNPPSYGFKLLDSAQLLQRIFPEFVALKGAQNVEGQSHKDNFYHTLEVLDNVARLTPDLWIRWGAVLHDIAKPVTKRYDPKVGWTFHGHEDRGARMVPQLFKRWKMPLNEHMKLVQLLVKLHQRPIALVKDGVTDSAIRRLMVDAGEALEALMLLCRCDITTKNKHKAQRYLANFEKVETRMKQVEEEDSLRNFQPVLTGQHIMDLTGLPPGKEVGDLKTAVREAILDGIVPNEIEPAMAYLKELLAQKGLG